jgi:hypothetical protein
MRIGGVDPKTLSKEEVLVLPRGDGQMVFKATGLADMSEFERLSPMPEPPKMLTKEGTVADTKDKGYVEAINGYWRRRQAFMVVYSLNNIEWDTVARDQPSTWLNWEDDLKSAGLSEMERNRVRGLVVEANCLDEAKLDRARASFLRGTPKEEPGSTLCGGLAFA